jgi:hypothetical protein
MEATGVRPVVDRVLDLEEIHIGFEAMDAGDVVGKIVINPRSSASSKSPSASHLRTTEGT